MTAAVDFSNAFDALIKGRSLEDVHAAATVLKNAANDGAKILEKENPVVSKFNEFSRNPNTQTLNALTAISGAQPKQPLLGDQAPTSTQSSTLQTPTSHNAAQVMDYKDPSSDDSSDLTQS